MCACQSNWTALIIHSLIRCVVCVCVVQGNDLHDVMPSPAPEFDSLYLPQTCSLRGRAFVATAGCYPVHRGTTRSRK